MKTYPPTKFQAPTLNGTMKCILIIQWSTVMGSKNCAWSINHKQTQHSVTL